MQPIVIVTRHPDYEDDIQFFELPEDTEVIYLDLGSAFDVSRPREYDANAALQWAAGWREYAASLGEQHPAYAHLMEVVTGVEEAYAPFRENDDEPMVQTRG